MRISTGQRVAIGLVAIWQVILLVGLLTSPSFREWDGLYATLFGSSISLIGIVLAIPKPIPGMFVAVTGTLLLFLAMPWLFPFFLPVPIVLGYRAYRASEAVSPTPTAPGT